MLACTRCGHWHSDAERILGKDLSCTEVKQFWSRIKAEHMERYGHAAKLSTDESGAVICFECRRRLLHP